MSESGYLAELRMDGLGLLVPQSAVRLVESVLDLHHDPQSGEVWLAGAAGRVAVWSLDHHLRPLPTLPEGRRFCALLGPDQALFGLTVGAFRLLPRETCRLYPLPRALRGPDSPLTGLAVLDERILPLSDAPNLARHLAHFGEVPA